MSYTTVNELMTAIADAIRSKTNTSAKISTQDMPSKILAIQAGSSAKVNVKNADELFYNRLALTNDVDDILVVNDNASAVRMFKGCNLNGIDLSKFDLSNVSNVESMFEEANFTGIILNDVIIFKVDNAASFFRNATRGSLDITKIKMPNLTRGEYMFYNFDISGIDFSTFFSSGKITDASNMFANTILKGVDFSKYDWSSVTNQRNMFKGANFTGVKDNTMKLMGDSIQGMFQDANMTNFDFSKLSMPNACNDYSFMRGCSGTINLTGWSLTKITDFGEMFCDCKSEQAIDMSPLSVNTAVKSTGNMFNGAYFTKIYGFTNWATAMKNVNYAGRMFSSLKKCTSLDLTGLTFPNVKDNNGAPDFINDIPSTLTEILGFPHFEISASSSSTYKFNNNTNTSVKKITFGGTWFSNSSTGAITLDLSMFQGLTDDGVVAMLNSIPANTSGLTHALKLYTPVFNSLMKNNPATMSAFMNKKYNLSYGT